MLSLRIVTFRTIVPVFSSSAGHSAFVTNFKLKNVPASCSKDMLFPRR